MLMTCCRIASKLLERTSILSALHASTAENSLETIRSSWKTEILTVKRVSYIIIIVAFHNQQKFSSRLE